MEKEEYLGDIDPAKWGLELVGELDTLGYYEYDLIGVWRGLQSRKLYYATDSGCSCSSPWDQTSKEDLTEVTEGELWDAIKLHVGDDVDDLASGITLFQRAITGAREDR